MLTPITFSAGDAPPSSVQQPRGYQIPPQHLYSRGGGHWPSFNPSLPPQQGSTHRGHYYNLSHFCYKRPHWVGIILLLYTNFCSDSISEMAKLAAKSFAVLIFGTFSCTNVYYTQYI